jgi:hypothetical protein
MGGRSPLSSARRAHHVPALALLEAALGAIILAAGLAVALTSAGSACATEDPAVGGAAKKESLVMVTGSLKANKI